MEGGPSDTDGDRHPTPALSMASRPLHQRPALTARKRTLCLICTAPRCRPKGCPAPARSQAVGLRSVLILPATGELWNLGRMTSPLCASICTEVAHL